MIWLIITVKQLHIVFRFLTTADH